MSLFAGENDEAFLEAVRAGDVAKVKQLLADGADVNATGRYEVTALAYACDRGNVELVSLLLDKGADLNRKDTFYGASAIDWASYNKHAAVVKILLERGSEGADAVLLTAVQEGNAELLQVVLESEKADAEALSRALATAKSSDKSEMVAALEKAGAKAIEKPKEQQISESVLQRYVGKYDNSDFGMKLTFSIENGALKGVVPGQPALTYAPENETTFKSVEFEGITVRFPEGTKAAESFELEQGNSKFTFKRSQPEEPAVVEEATPSIRPKGKIVAQNWPSFRGQGATGVADKQFPPVEWDVESGKNIKWKTPIPGLAHSSPIIWKDRLYITTALSSDTSSALRVGLYGDVAPDADVSEHSWRVYCINKNNGSIIWEREAYRGVPQVKRHTKATQANSTPVTNGKYVVALFGAEGLFCYNKDGELLWKQDLGYLDSGWFYDPDYQWGHASSPIIYRDMVIVQCDKQKDSYIAAYGLKDGKLLWKTDRDEIPSWSSPTVYSEGEAAELLTNGTHGIRGYNPETGAEIWTLKGNSEIAVPTPFVAHGMFYISSGYRPIQPIYAIKPGAKGDISLAEGETSSDHISWSTQRGGPYMPTPIIYEKNLFVCTNNGTFSCFDALTGERKFRERLGGRGGGYAFSASPVAADGLIYMSSEDGTIYVADAGDSYSIVAQNDVGEVVMATPAIADGMIFVRGQSHLFGIGE